jgi:hypothetical protein
MTFSFGIEFDEAGVLQVIAQQPRGTIQVMPSKWTALRPG